MSENELAANPETQISESEQITKSTSDDASQNLLADSQTATGKSDTAAFTIGKVDATVNATTSEARDLATLILGGPVGLGVYKENQKEIDPVLDVCERFSMEANMFPLRIGQRMAENTVNKPITTALELITFAPLTALHASVSVLNDRLKS